MNCRAERDILMCSSTLFAGFCDHKFCQSCFRKENTNVTTSSNHTFTCPHCHAPFYENILSIDEATIIGEAVTMRTHIFQVMRLPASAKISDESIISSHEANKGVIEKLEVALQLNPTSFYTLYLLFLCCSNGQTFLTNHEIINYPMNHYVLRLFDYSFRLFDFVTVADRYDFVIGECYEELARIFFLYHNYPAALKYSKLAYEECLRSSDHDEVSDFKALYLKSRANFAKMPPLRFAVGDEVEFLHEVETRSEWKLDKVVELYYRERDFEIAFTAPYRLQLLEDSAVTSPVYVWVKADIDRYVRKVGVRSIEDTRYQARLDAKVEELAQVYCSKKFILDIYRTLAQDHEFVIMLQLVWQIDLSTFLLSLYRMYVLYRQPLIRTDSGYHIPTAEEVIAGIKAYFDPSHLSSDAAGPVAGENSDSPEIRYEILCRFRGSTYDKSFLLDELDVQGLLVGSINNYLMVLTQGEFINISAGLHDGSFFTAPPEISAAISKASTKYAIRAMYSDKIKNIKVTQLLNAWNGLQTCLENPDAGSACECPWTYFFVKYCLDHGAGVPKLALTMYDRMNMQLSREFIRCANPTCELNKLDKSTRQVKFKMCSRCKAVIYCSRECQVAHYPEHKAYCRQVASVEKAASLTSEQEEEDNGSMDRCD